MRTILTLLSIIVAFMLYGTLHGVTSSFDDAIDQMSDTRPARAKPGQHHREPADRVSAPNRSGARRRGRRLLPGARRLLSGTGATESR